MSVVIFIVWLAFTLIGRYAILSTPRKSRPMFGPTVTAGFYSAVLTGIIFTSLGLVS